MEEQTPIWETDEKAREALLYIKSLGLSPAQIVAECASLDAPKCQCQWEAGDSPCRVHGEESE